MDNDGMAESLNREKFVPCRNALFTAKIVAKLKMRHRIVSNLEKVRRGEVSWAYTLPEMARLIEIHPSWIHRKISCGTIKIDRDSRYGCYLFPKEPQVVERMKQLKNRKVRHASVPRVHHDG
jgi:hypothetical protein